MRRRSSRRGAAPATRRSFLLLYAEVCRLFRRPEDYVGAAIAVAESLAEDGLRYAEIYVSPEISARFGLDPAACLEAIDVGFREALETHGILCRILLDAVRHWGPESADRVLDLYEKMPLPSIVGFGLGGDETSVPAAAFGGIYLRARALKLRTSVHAGEWAGPEVGPRRSRRAAPGPNRPRHRGGVGSGTHGAPRGRGHDPLRLAELESRHGRRRPRLGRIR